MQNHTLMMSCHSHGKDFAASVLAWSLSVVLLVALVGAQPARAEPLTDMLVSAYQFIPSLID